MSTSIKKAKKQPGLWRPIDVEKFNRNTEKVSKIFKSDPERINKKKDNNSKDV